MRELKFRVWSDYWKKYATEADLFMDGSVDVIFEDNDGVPHYENTDLVVEFKTGLKDKNGKEIYEGDILNRQYHNLSTYKANGVVKIDEVYDSDGWSAEKTLGWCCGWSSLLDICDDAEIIGNIHENPELLEEEDE